MKQRRTRRSSEYQTNPYTSGLSSVDRPRKKKERPATPGLLTLKEVSFWLSHATWDTNNTSSARMLLKSNKIEPVACLVINRKGSLLYDFNDLQKLSHIAARNKAKRSSGA